MATGSVFYAHGSGNRAADAAAYGAKLEKGLKRPVALSTWGVSAGPDQKFPRLSMTMPTVAAAFSAGAAGNAAALADPYASLRALGTAQAGAFAVGAKKASGKKAAKAAAAAKADAKAILAFLQLGGPDVEASGVSREQLSAAAAEVAASPEFAAAGGDPVDADRRRGHGVGRQGRPAPGPQGAAAGAFESSTRSARSRSRSQGRHGRRRHHRQQRRRAERPDRPSGSASSSRHDAGRRSCRRTSWSPPTCSSTSATATAIRAHVREEIQDARSLAWSWATASAGSSWSIRCSARTPSRSTSTCSSRSGHSRRCSRRSRRSAR